MYLESTPVSYTHLDVYKRQVSRSGSDLWSIRLWTSRGVPSEGGQWDDPDNNRRTMEGRSYGSEINFAEK